MRRILALSLIAAAPLSAEDKSVPKAIGLTGKKTEPAESDPLKTGSLPNSTNLLAEKAARLFSKRDFAAARAAYREMLQFSPENALAWANLGAVEQQDGNLPAAISCFEASVRFNEQLVQSWIALGLLYSQRGDRYKAISSFARAIHEEPLNPSAHNYLAIEANGLGWSATAMAELQRAIELDPNYGLAHFNLATLYLDQKPPARVLAKKHYEKALSLGVAKDEVLERRLDPK
ncbi:MAG: tetratricopeptide repeat protein [Verrucomicrobiaceae bacterium]|nr:tetratricopeptide repeat protein [Verrucomicrobiaceae bacterium]